MKNLLLTLFIFLTSYLFSQCTYSVWLRDTYGDGWNGGYLQVYINGVFTYGNYTLSSGSGPVIYNFNVFQGQSISVRYYPGSWSSENYYRVYAGPNATGSLLISTPTYQTPPTWTYPSNLCSSPLQTQPPSSITATTNNSCPGQTVTLTANNSVGTTYWFTNGCSTAGQIATGATINVNPSTTTTYWARNFANGIWSSTCAQTTISVNTSVQAPTPINLSINCGVSPTLTAVGGPGNYQWWSNSNATGLLATGQTYNPGSITSNTTYYVTAASGASGTYNQTSNTIQTMNTPGVGTSLVTSTPATASGNATLTVYIRGDIDNSTEWVNVVGESGSLGNVWGGSQCGGFISQTYSIPAATINSWASNGSIQVTFNSSSSVNNICGWGAFQAYFTISYPYSGGCNSQTSPYTITTIPLTQPTANNTSVNCGNSTTLSITNAANNVVWYQNSNGTGQVGTGSTYTTPQLTSSTTYYVGAGSGACATPLTPVTVTVNNNLQQPTINGTSIVCGQTSTLSATGSPGGYIWYSNSTGTTQVGTGANYTTPQLQANTTYWVASTSGGGGGNFTYTSPTIYNTNNPGTSSTSTVPSTPQASGNATLTVTARGDFDYPGSGEYLDVYGENNTYLGQISGPSNCNWYTGTYTISQANINNWATNGTITLTFIPGGGVNTGQCNNNSYEVYYTLTYQSASGCQSNLVPVTVTVNPLAAPTTNTPTISCGSIANITASGTGTITWYSNSTLTTQLGTGNNYTTPNLSTSTTYYLTATSGSCVSSSTPVTVNVNPLQAPTINGNTNICLGNSTTLTATGGNNYTWYSNSNGTGVLGTGGSYTTPSLSTNTTYWVGSQSQPVSQTVVYNINSIGQLFNMNSNCGTGSYYNGCSGQAGFNWTSSIPAGATIVSVQIQLSVGVECQAGTRTTTLNGVNGPTFNTLNHCSCSGSINPIFTLNMNPANYIANGTNQFRVTNPPSCFGLFNGNGALSGLFAKVTVVYQSGSACSSSLASVPITVSNTTQFNQQSMPVMQVPSESIISHPSGQYSWWYNGFQNDQYIAISSVQGDYLTVRMGQPQGALVAQGTQPVSFTGPATGSYYIHVNTNSNCGTDNQLRTITVNRVSALPVELISFSGECNSGLVEINWKTATEHNSDYFEIMKSRDGQNWESLGKVESAGNSTEELSYDYVDPVGGEMNYYKLLQFDIDGVSEEFGPIQVSCQKSSKGYFGVFPNPSAGQFSVIINDKNMIGESKLLIRDGKGSLIKSIDVKIIPGINLFTIEDKLTPGVYFITIEGQNNITSVVKEIIR